MKIKTCIPLTAVCVLALLTIGCGGGSSGITASGASTTPQPLTIAFQPAPPVSILLNATTSVTAVVKNDSSNAGVDWALTCASKVNCGTLGPLHTASGVAATYTPPSSLSGNSQTVNIVAFASADHNLNVFAQLAITGFASTLKGSYVMQARGVDATGFPYHFAGVVSLDGNGNVSAGEQTYTDIGMSSTDLISGGSYSVGPDGRGTLNLITANQNIGQSGVEAFNLAVLSSSNALISKVDDPTLSTVSTSTGTGTMDLQTSIGAPASGYAFVASGTDVASFSPTAFGGVLNIDSPGAISGNGSVADQDVGGVVTTNSTIAGTVTAPDAMGMVKFYLTPAFASLPVQFAGYIVDSSHIKLVECDNATGTGFGSTSGVAVGQGTATGTFTSNSVFTGRYVFESLGQDFSGLPASLSLLGVVIPDGTSQINGIEDQFFGGLLFGFSDHFGSHYNVDPTGNGRIDTHITFQNNGSGPEYIYYLTGNGNTPLFLDFDITIGSVAAGLLTPQAAAPFTFSGRYGMSFTQSLFGSENDATGVFVADPTALTITGTIDTNFFFSPLPNTPLTGTTMAIPTSGRTFGTLSNQLFSTPTITTTLYFINSGHGYFVEADSLTTAMLTFGYFAQRTLICSTCP